MTEHHMEFVSLKGGCTGSSESTLVKMSHCWKSHVTAHLVLAYIKSEVACTAAIDGSFSLNHRLAP